MNIHGKIAKKDRILSIKSYILLFFFYHEDLEKREGCRVMAHERHDSQVSR